jgi:hypothetical protein
VAGNGAQVQAQMQHPTSGSKILGPKALVLITTLNTSNAGSLNSMGFPLPAFTNRLHQASASPQHILYQW